MRERVMIRMFGSTRIDAEARPYVKGSRVMRNPGKLHLGPPRRDRKPSYDHSLERGPWRIVSSCGFGRHRSREVSRIIGGLTLLVLCAGPAAAKCQDAPGPGADWSGCSKARLVLTGEDLTGTIFQRSLLTLSDFAFVEDGGSQPERNRSEPHPLRGSRTCRAPTSPRRSAGGPISGRPISPGPFSSRRT